MATDVKLDQVDGSYLVLEGRVVKSEASDFMIDAAGRRSGGGPFRRALVHDQGDSLTVNFANDYPGGLNLNGVAEISPRKSSLRDIVPTLVVHGGISFEVETLALVGHGISKATLNVGVELSKLHSQIEDLAARIAVLEARK